MIIQHNMTAANANRQLGQVVTNQAKSTEKLSSGYRINRAADDAAGLSISEKMRGQIRGLEQASTNAQDGISLIQTAEGALNETHSILQRMRELSVQAANGTATSEDRESIQAEINQLQDEVNRISETTEFNTMSLLDGSFSTTFQIGANAGQTMQVSIGSMSTNSLGLTSGVTLSGTETASVTGLADGEYTLDGTDLKDAKGNVVATYNDTDKKLTVGATTNDVLSHALTNGSTIKIEDGKGTITLKPDGTDATDKLAAGNYTVSGDNLLLGDKLIGTIQAKTGGATAKTDLKLADGTIVDMEKLGLTEADLAGGSTFTIKGINVSDADKASNSTTTIDEAIKSVSKQRSALGAVQNRLEHTIANLDTSAENLQTAESRIRDVDMASEMVNFTKNNILQQAAQSMLAQANQSTQGVLSLLG